MSLDIHDTSLPDEVSLDIWRDFDRAVDQAGNACDGLLPRAELLALLAEVRQAVRAAVVADGASVESAAPPELVARVIDAVRREFTDAVRAERAADTRQAIHVLSALGRIQSRLAAPPAYEGRVQPTVAEALRPAVEVAHDMRSPLAAMLFLVEMVRSGRSGRVSALQEQQLGMVYGAALGLNQLACDLIDYVRGEDRLIDEQPAPFSVAEVLHAVYDIVRPMAEEKGVRVQLAFPEDDARMGQAGALQRVLLNLATNAVKFSAEGTVTVSARQLAGPRVELEVHDFADGIPPAAMAQLFEPFRVSGASQRRTFSSSGLGLTICHRLVSRLGGELRVVTGAERGTRFYFELDLPAV